MTERELIDRLCDLRPEWSARRAKIHRAQVYYVDGADLGRQLVGAVLEGLDEPWMRDGFGVIERALTEGPDETRGLVVTGLFETMQGPAYDRAEPPDLLDTWLGPRSRTAWADLIEGWTGEGIRSVEAWRTVIINGPRHRIRLRAPELELEAELAEGIWPTRLPGQPLDPALPNHVRWSRGASLGEWTPSVADTERLVAALAPLRGVRCLGQGRVEGDVHATLAVDGAQGPAEITFGRSLGPDEPWLRMAQHGDRLFAVDYDALIARFAWVAER